MTDTIQSLEETRMFEPTADEIAELGLFDEVETDSTGFALSGEATEEEVEEFLEVLGEQYATQPTLEWDDLDVDPWDNPSFNKANDTFTDRLSDRMKAEIDKGNMSGVLDALDFIDGIGGCSLEFIDELGARRRRALMDWDMANLDRRSENESVEFYAALSGMKDLL